MKTFLLSLTLIVIFFSACNNSGSIKQASDSATLASTGQQIPVNTMPANKVLAGYLTIKNALTHDNDKEAAAGATELSEALKNMDKSSFNADQMKVYNDVEADAREHADHIASNAGNLAHQREHFETLSTEMYELMKATGAGQKLYYTNCPMYNNNKGANWLSEMKEVKNPYLGMAMSTCGSVTEELN